MLLVHQRGVFFQCTLGVEHEGQRLVLDLDRFGGVFRQRARVGDHRRHPFAGIARDAVSERAARDVGRVEAGEQRVGGFCELGAVEDVMHARHFQRRALVDALDARGCMRAGDERDVARLRQLDIGDEIALAGDETAVLPHAAVRGDETEFFKRAHSASSVGRLTPRMRSAASAIASMICA